MTHFNLLEPGDDALAVVAKRAEHSRRGYEPLSDAEHALLDATIATHARFLALGGGLASLEARVAELEAVRKRVVDLGAPDIDVGVRRLMADAAADDRERRVHLDAILWHLAQDRYTSGGQTVLRYHAEALDKLLPRLDP